jgi:hypothetical protein
LQSKVFAVEQRYNSHENPQRGKAVQVRQSLQFGFFLEEMRVRFALKMYK